MHEELDKIAEKVVTRLQRYQLKGRTLTLKIKYHDFKQITRNQSFPAGIDDLMTIQQTAKALLEATDITKKIRLLGISLSNFGDTQQSTVKEISGQLRLFNF